MLPYTTSDHGSRGASGSSPASFFSLKILAGKSFPNIRVVIWSDHALKISPRLFLIRPPLNAITNIAKSAKPWEDFRTSHNGIG